MTAPPLAAVALLAAAALGYEVLLTRLFAIIQWHHFAFMVISLALLGYGASGSLLALLGPRTERHGYTGFAASAVLFGMTSVAGFLIAQRLAFNTLELAWNPWQLAHLLAQYLLLAVPFFCAATGIGLALLVWRDHGHRIYGVDLAGAGSGAAGLVLLLYVVHPLVALGLIGLCGALSALLAVRSRRARLWVMLGALLIGLPYVQGRPDLQLSEFKDLSQALRAAGAERIAERSGPLGLIDVVDNDTIPIRYAPGLSLAATDGPPQQLGLYVDGDAQGAITRSSGDPRELAFLDQLDSALPYRLLERPEVLVLGAGGGLAVLQALHQGAARVDAVEPNAQLVALLQDGFAAFAGWLYQRSGVTVHVIEPRRFAAATDRRYDLIRLAAPGGAGSAGLQALETGYNHTVEAFDVYLARLEPGGLLAVSGWLRQPPRASLKLFATAVEALERRGVATPGQRLALIRGWRTWTLLVKHGAFTGREIAALRQFSRERSFDTAYYPDMPVAEANRYNQWPEPYLYRGTQALLGDGRKAYYRAYKFDIHPATDDRPYFQHFFKWRTLPELWSLRAGAGLAQLEWGYLVLVATLAQALLAALVLIPLPLLLGRRRLEAATPRWRVLVYFSALGLGFLFLELACIERFTLFLGHPLYAVAVVLAAFLVWAGLGSLTAGRLPQRSLTLRAVALAVALLAGLYLLLPTLLDVATHWTTTARIAFAVVLLGPLAFVLGMPFPLGLMRLGPGQIPWAWAINGCASVVSAVLTLLLAMHIGFSGVLLAAAGLYLLAAVAAPSRSRLS